MLTSYFYPTIAGAELFVYEIGKRLAKDGHEVHILTKRFPKNTKKYELHEGMHIHRIGFLDFTAIRSLTSIPAMIKESRRIIKEKDIDIIHAHITYPNGIIGGHLKKNKSKPLIITIQGDELFNYPELSLINLIKPRIIKALKYADKVHSVSNALKDSITGLGVDPKTVEVIPNGVNISDFNLSIKSSIRKDFNLKDSKVIITTSRLTPKNGIDTLIEAFAKINKKHSNTTLLILGNGPEEQNLKDLVSGLKLSKRVRFLGYIDHKDVPKYLKASDIFVRTPLMEGFGISFIEAMAFRLPTIGTDVDGIKDIITTGEDGILVPPDDVEKTAEAILKILENDAFAKKIGENARKTVETRFDWDIVYDKMLSLYKSVLK